jgi:hypothetical protein
VKTKAAELLGFLQKEKKVCNKSELTAKRPFVISV